MKCIAYAVVTIDGKIAKGAFHDSSWSSPEDKQFLRKHLDASDVLVVGNNTYKTAFAPLSKRNCIVFTSTVSTSHRENERCLYVNPTTVDIVSLLKSEHYAKVAVLGGTQVFNYFLEKELLDELYITIEPLIFGSGLGLFDIDIPEQRYTLKSTKTLNTAGTVLLHYSAKGESGHETV